MGTMRIYIHYEKFEVLQTKTEQLQTVQILSLGDAQIQLDDIY